MMKSANSSQESARAVKLTYELKRIIKKELPI